MSSMHRCGCAILVLVTGCATAPPPAPTPPVAAPPPTAVTQPYPRIDEPPAPATLPAEAGGVDQALDFVNRVRARPAREQREQHDALRKRFAATRSDHDRVRLALMLGLPNTAFADEAQALELLEPLVRDTVNAYHTLAQLLTVLLAEQRRIGRQAASLQQKLDRLRALEADMQRRAVPQESKRR